MAPDDPTAPGRKADHLRIAAEPGIEHARGAGLAELRLRHRALPERDLDDVSLRCDLLGAGLGAPLLISAMTGGTAEAAEVNARLAHAAAEHRIGLVLGSGRPLLDDPALLPTYRPAGGPRPPLLLANLGAAQVRGPGAPQRAERLLELLDADGLTIHLNPVQEAVQPEGQPAFSGVLDGIAAIVARLAPRPVVVKEVGFGLDARGRARCSRRPGSRRSTWRARAGPTGRSSRASATRAPAPSRRPSRTGARRPPRRSAARARPHPGSP